MSFLKNVIEEVLGFFYNEFLSFNLGCELIDFDIEEKYILFFVEKGISFRILVYFDFSYY